VQAKKTIIFLAVFLSCFRLHPLSFEALYDDLTNLWIPGRRPTCFGIEQYVQMCGSYMSTNNETDFSIKGNGFFVVYDDINDKTYLTRNGRFMFNGLWFLTNQDGFYVLGSNGGYLNYADFSAGFGDVFFRASDDFFLLAVPKIETLNTYTDMYIDVSSFTAVEGSDVINKTLEANPATLDMLLDAALLGIDGNIDCNDSRKLINLFYQRYSQMNDFYQKYEEQMKRLVSEDEYTGSILTKIQQLENMLL